MTSSWQARIEPAPRSKAAREEAADTLIAAGDALIKKLAIHEHPELSVYQRYSGYFSARHSDYITGHERYQCHADRDHGAARLIQIYSEQLRHMVPRPPRETGPFREASSKAIGRMGQATTRLCEHANALHRLHPYHGQRYRKGAEPLLATIEGDLREMRLALRGIDAQLPGDNTTETMIISHCKGLLDVIEQCHQHAFEMLPSPPTKPSGRVR